MATQLQLQPVLVLTHKEKRQVYPLSRSSLTIGRSSVADICVFHGQVSRCQSTIQCDPHGQCYLIFDGDGRTRTSRNGTYVNWQKVQWSYLQPEDVICFGSPAVVARFCVIEADQEPFATQELIRKIDDIPTELVLPFTRD